MASFTNPSPQIDQMENIIEQSRLNQLGDFEEICKSLEERIEIHKKAQEMRKNYLEDCIGAEHKRRKKERVDIEISIGSTDEKVVHTTDFVDRSFK